MRPLPDATPEQNGDALWQRLRSLTAGDRLLIAHGEYRFRRKVTLNPEGTAEAPIWIEAENIDKPPVLTRGDARQNLLNVGEGQPARFLVLRGLELKGGSIVTRFGDCEDIWLDRCHLHHGHDGGITVNTHDARRIFITGNTMHHFEGGTGEAMYLGANNGKHVLSYSVIADNHVHDCSGSQGDGIELKQGSHHNWIVGNIVHDTKYPGIIAYGTGGNGINVIERNTIFRSKTQGMQVQGEAIVRNNIILNCAGDAFLSTDHQGKTTQLRLVHNTIITTGRGVNLSSWNNRQQMVFANNAIYSKSGSAVRFPAGCDAVTISGNVVTGKVEGCRQRDGFRAGQGLTDFQSATWDGSKSDVTLSTNSALHGAADPKFATKLDHAGRKRGKPFTSGALSAHEP